MRTKPIALSVIGLLILTGGAACVLISLRAQNALHRNELALLNNRDHLKILATQYEQLRAARTNSAEPLSTNAPDIQREIHHLEAQAEQLKQRKNELANQTTETNPVTSRPKNFTLRSRSDYRSKKVVTDSTSEKYREQLFELASTPTDPISGSNPRKDAQNLGQAVRKYARANDGQFPTNFEAAAQHLYPDLPLPAAHDFDLVFHGTTNDLNGIPHQSVALIRQRDPWPTPEGKSARIYVMADGLLRVVESDDNFQTWEADHIVPPE